MKRKPFRLDHMSYLVTRDLLGATDLNLGKAEVAETKTEKCTRHEHNDTSFVGRPARRPSEPHLDIHVKLGMMNAYHQPQQYLGTPYHADSTLNDRANRILNLTALDASTGNYVRSPFRVLVTADLSHGYPRLVPSIVQLNPRVTSCPFATIMQKSTISFRERDALASSPYLDECGVTITLYTQLFKARWPVFVSEEYG